MNTPVCRPVRLKIARGYWPKGHVFTGMGGGEARELIKRGIAEFADETLVPAAADDGKPKRKAKPGRTLLDRLGGREDAA